MGLPSPPSEKDIARRTRGRRFGWAFQQRRIEQRIMLGDAAAMLGRFMPGSANGGPPWTAARVSDIERGALIPDIKTIARLAALVDAEDRLMDWLDLAWHDMQQRSSGQGRWEFTAEVLETSTWQREVTIRLSGRRPWDGLDALNRWRDLGKGKRIVHVTIDELAT